MFKPGDLVKLTIDHAAYKSTASWLCRSLKTNKQVELNVSDIYKSILEVIPRTDPNDSFHDSNAVILVHIVAHNAILNCSYGRLTYYNEKEIP